MSGDPARLVRVLPGSGELSLGVRVTPGAAVTAVRGVYGDRLKVAVSAPAEEGRANEQLLAFLGRSLGLKTGQLRVERGHRKRDKVIAFSGVTEAQLCDRLSRLLAET